MVGFLLVFAAPGCSDDGCRYGIYEYVRAESIEGSCDPATMDFIIENSLRFGWIPMTHAMCEGVPCGEPRTRAVTILPTFRTTLTLGKKGLEAELEVVHTSGCSEHWELVYEYASPCSAVPDAGGEPFPDTALSPDAAGLYCDGSPCEGEDAG